MHLFTFLTIIIDNYKVKQNKFFLQICFIVCIHISIEYLKKNIYLKIRLNFFFLFSYCKILTMEFNHMKNMKMGKNISHNYIN